MLLNNKILKDISHKNDLRKQEQKDFIKNNAYCSGWRELHKCIENKNLWTREFLCMTYGDFMSKYCHIGAVFLHPWKPWLFVRLPEAANHYSSNLLSLPINTNERYTKGANGKPMLDKWDADLFEEPKFESLNGLEVRHLDTYVYKGYPSRHEKSIGEGLNHRWQAYLKYSFSLEYENSYFDYEANRYVKDPNKEFIFDYIMGRKSEYAQEWDEWFGSECRKKGYHSTSASYYLDDYTYGRRDQICYVLNEEGIKIVQKKFKDLPKKMLSINYNDEKEQEEVIIYNVEQGKKLLRLQEEREKQKEKEEEEEEVEVEEESWYEEVECEEYLYLMKNNLNGQYKIGRSNNPSYRERTLQSQEPDVNLVAKFKGLAYLEREWHDYFDSERVRGEWFKLNSTQLNFMISKCKSSKAPPIRKQEAELK